MILDKNNQIVHDDAETHLVKSRTVILDLRIGTKSFQGSLNLDQVIDEDSEDKPDPEFVRATKSLINRKELSKLRSLDMTFKRDLLDVSIPNGLFRNGLYLINVMDVVPTVIKIKDFITKRQLIVDNLFSNDHYEMLIREAEERLGPRRFNRANYPPVSYVRMRHSVSYQLITVDMNLTLEDLDVEMMEEHRGHLEFIFAEEREKMKERWKSATDDVKDALRSQLLKLTQTLEEKLTPDHDGKPKVLREPTVDKLKSFLDTFDQKNITNDAELMVLAGKAREALEGVNINKLRYDDGLRDAVKNVFHGITEELAGMVVKTSHRQFFAPTEEV